MSSLWTPGGEHPVEPESAAPIPPPAAGPGPSPEEILAAMSPEERAEAEAMVAEMAQARQRVLEAPADMVVANHAMGLYELAAIHLSEEQPDLASARLAIDAMGQLVDGLAGRLGEAEATLKDALAQLRMAFVQLSEQAAGGEAPRGGRPQAPRAGRSAKPAVEREPDRRRGGSEPTDTAVLPHRWPDDDQRLDPGAADDVPMTTLSARSRGGSPGRRRSAHGRPGQLQLHQRPHLDGEGDRGQVLRVRGPRRARWGPPWRPAPPPRW